ncbi:AcvB/VirJ family lysyl-phosphatidylglycerol hydrolase [Sphingomonas solaris]|uniref:Type IV secretion system protein VirJ n=1 Tax=Alterirhizorhabdus solaris TaxID=2529389 RepID=A0A558QUH4_9SPHN|nr:AcvB/VirJ family lysyl-phosphatidylglycerol hydrolase [Sphingomonas solaris]TVV70784.1 type IV secretion system protein VirJ [Sphingomonas solaris]
MSPPASRRRPFRRLLGVAALVALMLAVAAGLMLDKLDRLGYFGGPLFTLLRQAVPPADGIGVVLLSGDMGLNVGLGPKVAARMAAAGRPVVAVNSLTFAADGRTPAEVRALVRTAITRALALPGVRRVVLIGQSFGSDLLHVGLVGLPQPLRSKVALVILEVPTDSIYLTAGFREYFELGTPDLQPLDSARQLDWVPVTCIRGAEETTSLCPMLTLPNVRTVTLPGGHKLNRDDAALFAAANDAIIHHRRP